MCYTTLALASASSEHSQTGQLHKQQVCLSRVKAEQLKDISCSEYDSEYDSVLSKLVNKVICFKFYYSNPSDWAPGTHCISILLFIYILIYGSLINKI